MRRFQENHHHPLHHLPPLVDADNMSDDDLAYALSAKYTNWQNAGAKRIKKWLNGMGYDFVDSKRANAVKQTFKGKIESLSPADAVATIALGRKPDKPLGGHLVVTPNTDGGASTSNQFAAQPGDPSVAVLPPATVVRPRLGKGTVAQRVYARTQARAEKAQQKSASAAALIQGNFRGWSAKQAAKQAAAAKAAAAQAAADSPQATVSLLSGQRADVGPLTPFRYMLSNVQM